MDDDLDVMPQIKDGWEYDSRKRKMVFTGQLRFEEPCVRTARIIQNIANSLEPDIQLTCDTPNNHPSGRMPVLDLEVWVKDNRIMHSFYSKPMSSKYTILKRTALSDNVKKHTIFQECIRRLSNVCVDLPWQETVRHMKDFSRKLQNS